MAIKFISDLDAVRKHNDRIYATRGDLFVVNIKLGAHTEPESLVKWRSQGDERWFISKWENCEQVLGYFRGHRYQLCIPKKELEGYFLGTFVVPYSPSIPAPPPAQLRREHLDHLIRILQDPQYQNYEVAPTEEPLEFYFAIWSQNNVTLFKNFRVIFFNDEPAVASAFMQQFDRLRNTEQAMRDKGQVITWLQGLKKSVV